LHITTPVAILLWYYFFFLHAKAAIAFSAS